jgi:outer membrane lipoprotein-sorting protein
MRLTFFSLAVGAGLFTQNTLGAGLTTAEDVMKFSIEKSDAYKTFSADMSQSMSMMGATMTVNGHMQFKHPALMRFEMEMPMMGQTQKVLGVIGADKVVWQEMHMGTMTQVIKIDFEKTPTNSPAAAAMKNPFDKMDPKQQWRTAQEKYDFKLVGTDELHGQRMYVVLGMPKPDAKWTPQETAIGMNSSQDKVHIGQQDGFMHKMEMLDKSGTNVFMSMEFTNLRFNEDIPDSQFEYKPAPGVQVMDMTQMMQQMMAPPPTPRTTAPQKETQPNKTD